MDAATSAKPNKERGSPTIGRPTSSRSGTLLPEETWEKSSGFIDSSSIPGPPVGVCTRPHLVFLSHKQATDCLPVDVVHAHTFKVADARDQSLSRGRVHRS